MTHTLTGNILLQEKICEKDRLPGNKSINDIVMQTARQFGVYCLEYCPDLKITKYYREDDNQPFIDVMDTFALLSDSKCIKSHRQKNLYLIISVKSGSHVSVMDTSYSMEIYDVTMALRKAIQREIPMDIEVLFDDEHQFFLPREFRGLIKSYS